MLLINKVAIITGSTSGIGESVASTFAEHGAKVLVTGLDAERGLAIAGRIASEGGEAIFVPADLSDLDSPALLVRKAVEEWGRIDIVVNNAALICHKPNKEVTHGDWDRLFAVNVKAAFFLIQAALPYLEKSKGAVVNVSSINGVRNAQDNLVYDTMKAALNHMTSGFVIDNLKSGIRFNSVMPAGVHTPLLEQWVKEAAKNDGPRSVTMEQLSNSPAVAQPRQIADAIVLLASGLASWMNGAIIPLEGGFSLGHPN